MMSLAEPPQETELDSYLKGGFPTEDLLTYWKSNKPNCPNLAKLAKICLGIKALSGGVERRFLIAGALQRSHRARLSPRTIEQIVLVAEHVRARENL